MAKSFLYKNFSDDCEEQNLAPGKAIKDYYPDLDFAHIILIVNGKKTDENHIISESDILLIRWIPLSDNYSFGDFFMDLLTVGIWSGVKNAKAAEEAKKEAEKLRNQLSKTKDDVTNLPYLRGSQNSVATGRTQPYFIGEHLFTPYILNASKSGSYSKGYHTISGTNGAKQYLHRVYELGFSEQILKKIFISDVTIKNFSEKKVQNGVYNLPASAFTGSGSFIEIAQGKDFTKQAFNKKIVEKEYSDELKLHEANGSEGDYKPLYYTLEKNSMAADICIMFNGLMWYNSDGKTIEAERELCVCWSSNYARLAAEGAPDINSLAVWHPFLFSGADSYVGYNSHFKRKTNKQMRFCAHVDFNYSDAINLSYPITIRLSAPSDADRKYKKNSGYRNVYVEWVHSYTYDVTRSKAAGSLIPERIIEPDILPYCTLLGMCLEATSANADKTDALQVVTSGIARTFSKKNGSYSLSASRVATSNPAAWYVEVLTSSTHRPSQFETSEIDIQSFGAWYDFCSSKGFSVNKVLSEGVPKENVLQMIASCGRASVYRNIYGQIAVAIDTKKENAVGILNEQNMIRFSWEKDLGRLPDGIKASYIDASQEYQDNTILVMYDGSVNPETRAANSIITEKKCDGRTNWQNAYLDALYEMKTSKLRRKTCTAEVGKEGIFFIPLSKFFVQHPSLKIGLGSAEIKALITQNENITGLELFDYITLDTENNFSVIIQCVGTDANGNDYCTPLAVEIRGHSGRTNEITFKKTISLSSAVIPHPGDILSFGHEIETVTSPMLLTEVSPTEKGYTLKLIDYDERVYDNTSSFPEYEPNLTQPQNNPARVPENLPSVSYEDFYAAHQAVIQNDGEIPSNVESLTALAFEEGIRLLPSYTAIRIFDSVQDFVYEVKKGENENWEKADVKNGIYYFNRRIDGYPEKTENGGNLDQWQFRIKVLNVYGQLSQEWCTASVDASEYLTWKIPEITASSETVDRTVIITASYIARNRPIYGTVKTQVRIKRLGNTDPAISGTINSQLGIAADEEYHTPEFNKTVQESRTGNTEENYKKTTQSPYETSGNKISQTLPLIGQTARIFKNGNEFTGIFTFEVEDYTTIPENPSKNAIIHFTGNSTSDFIQNKYYQFNGTEWEEVFSKRMIASTTYRYEIVMTNESGYKTQPLEIDVTALGTSIVDVVHSHEYYKEMYVEKLSAISANIGMISQGGMGDFKSLLNYWALSDLPAEESGISGGVKKGSFRVGGSDQYLKVEPDPENEGEFLIELKAGNITLASGTDASFKKGTYIYDRADETKRLVLIPTGMVAQQFINGEWQNLSKINIDSNGNLIITNSDSLPPIGVRVQDADIYHFETSAIFAEDGTNPQNITSDGHLVNNAALSPILSETSSRKCFSGTVEKDITSFSGRVMFFSKADKIEISKYIGTDGAVTDNPEYEYNSGMKSTSPVDTSTTVGKYLGLSATQISNGIFKNYEV